MALLTSLHYRVEELVKGLVTRWYLLWCRMAWFRRISMSMQLPHLTWDSVNKAVFDMSRHDLVCGSGH